MIPLLTFLETGVSPKSPLSLAVVADIGVDVPSKGFVVGISVVEVPVPALSLMALVVGVRIEVVVLSLEVGADIGGDVSTACGCGGVVTDACKMVLVEFSSTLLLVVPEVVAIVLPAASRRRWPNVSVEDVCVNGSEVVLMEFLVPPSLWVMLVAIVVE